MGSGRVLGVDACKRGWIAIAVEDAIARAYFAEEIQTLMGRAEADGPLGVVAIDMPIGLPDRGAAKPTCWRVRRSARHGPRYS